MHIWYLIGTLSVGGAERTLVDLANALDRDEFTVTVWTISEPGPLATDLADHVHLRTLDARHKADIASVLRFVCALRAARPAVLQSFLFFDNVLSRLAGVVSPGTTVVSGVRSVPNNRRRHRDLADRATLPLADYVVSNSAAGAEYAIERGTNPDAVRVIRNGRRLATYADATVPEGYRATLGISPGPLVGTVGRLIERKGHYDLLAAWPRVRAVHPEAQLVIVGSGPESEGLARRAAVDGVADSVHLLGRRDDVPTLLAAFDVFAFPSHFEGLSGALLEAMAAGCPIVCTPVDGNSELVTHNQHGLHVPPQSPDALADAISTLLSDSDRAARLGTEASERAHTDFTLERMVAEFTAFYRTVASSRSAESGRQ